MTNALDIVSARCYNLVKLGGWKLLILSELMLFQGKLASVNSLIRKQITRFLGPAWYEEQL